jgi:hypothetical protein
MKVSASAVSVSLVALMVLSAAGQVLHTLASPNEQVEGGFGAAVSCVRDIDGDACEDVVVSAPSEAPWPSPEHAGRAYVFSGASGYLIRTLASPHEEQDGFFGCSIAGAGDVNNDGYEDVVGGAHWESPNSNSLRGGRAYVFSGATGEVLHDLASPNAEPFGYFGYSVAGPGDVNGDGCADVLVGAYYEDPGSSPTDAGRVYVFDGLTGGILHTLASPNEEVQGSFGQSVSGAGDVDNDGFDDVVIGAPDENPGASPATAGRAYVFSGATGQLVHALSSPNQQSYGYFGYSVSGVGDADGDAYEDVVIGARAEDLGPGLMNAGRAYVFSGRTGALIHPLASPNPEEGGLFGHCVSAAGDVNNDGHADVMVGAHLEDPGGAENAGRAYVFSGATGSVLHQLTSPNPEGWGFFGYSVSQAGDVNAGGYVDVVVGAGLEDPGSSPVDAGRAYVFAPMDVPIELASFRGEALDGAVHLTWMTLSERNNLGFNVERAFAPRPGFVRLNDKLIPGAGTSSEPHTYQYADCAVEPAITYWYRLEDVSVTGERSYHGPIQVVIPAQPELGLAILGGASPTFVLSFQLPGRGSLKLHDLSGRLISVLWEGQASGGDRMSVGPRASRGIPPGVYAATLAQGGRAVTRRLVIPR